MAPFVMEIVNSRIIHRSAALAATPYGSDFKCERAGQLRPGRRRPACPGAHAPSRS